MLGTKSLLLGVIIILFSCAKSSTTPPVAPQIPSQFECTQVLTFAEGVFVVTGYLNWNFDIQRSLFTTHSVSIDGGKNIPDHDKVLYAYDIDNEFHIHKSNCSTTPNEVPMSIFFQYFYTYSTVPQPFGAHFIAEIDYTSSTGTQSVCNLWELKYFGECGPTVPPPCTQIHYLCATTENIPVYFEFLDYYGTNTSIFVEYDNVIIQNQPADLFAIPSSCPVFPYPPTSPFGLREGFENEKVAEFWIPCGDRYSRWECGHIYAQSTFVRSGKYAANITIQPGDINDGGGTERDELDSRPWLIGGMDVWYGFSFLLPVDFPIVDDRLVMGQWKQSNAGDKHPLIAQRFQNGKWYYTINVGTTKVEFDDIGDLELGVWHDMIYNIKFSPKDDGYLKVWHNGTIIINYVGRTSYDYMAPRFYSKFGLYRDDWNTSWTCFFDNYAIGQSYAEVNPAQFDEYYPGYGVH